MNSLHHPHNQSLLAQRAQNRPPFHLYKITSLHDQTNKIFLGNPPVLLLFFSTIHTEEEKWVGGPKTDIHWLVFHTVEVLGLILV